MIKERRLQKGLNNFMLEEANSLQNLFIKQSKQIKEFKVTQKDSLFKQNLINKIAFVKNFRLIFNFIYFIFLIFVFLFFIFYFYFYFYFFCFIFFYFILFFYFYFFLKEYERIFRKNFTRR